MLLGVNSAALLPTELLWPEYSSVETIALTELS